MELKGQRAFGPDLVRAVAVILVPSVHFFGYTWFYLEPTRGLGMALSAWVRMCCMSCVPLFLMLSGYLCSGKKWSPGYYRRIVPILLSYGLAGVACVLFRVLYLGESFSWQDILLQFTSYVAAPYGWYIEMYVGLFLLIPFLNAAWQGLDGRGRAALVGTLLLLTSVAGNVNAFFRLLPEWWLSLYPLTYYCLGAWLRERPVKLRSGWLLLGWPGLAAAAAALRFHMLSGGAFDWSRLSDWDSLFVMGGSVCLFSLLLRLGEKKWPRPARWAVSRLAAISLQVYLISYVSDWLIYPRFTALGLSVGRRLLCMPLVVGSSILLACLMGQVLCWVVNFLCGLWRKKEVQGNADP